jgi:hypothetical protein
VRSRSCSPVQRDNGAESRRAAGFGSQQNSVAAAAKVVPCMRGAVESFVKPVGSSVTDLRGLPHEGVMPQLVES